MTGSGMTGSGMTGSGMTGSGMTGSGMTGDGGLAARERDLLWHTYTRAPRLFTRARGTHIYDAEGREYLDFLGGIATVAAGHANPHVVEAVSTQLGRLGHTTNLYFTGPQLDLAERLVRHFGGGARVFFGNSGAEANEAAIKLARRWGKANRGPEAVGIVSALGAFHGRTLATLAATGKPAMHEPFAPMPSGFAHVPYGDADALAEAIDGTTAAVLLEPIQGEAGVVVPPDGYLAAARKLTRDAGVLLILDEIQGGMGRTGRFFAHQHELSLADRPDIVTMAKALGNGFPIGACLATGTVADAMRPGDHGTTFGGGPVACTAAMATLDVIEPLLPERVTAAGARLLDGLSALARRYAPSGGHARGRGLWCALDLAGAIGARDVALAALDQGLVVNPVTDDALRLAPPLTVSDSEIDEGLARLERALQAVTAGPGTGEGGTP
jgi:acetylornithine/N-succinyldiaminopimelate aminotransferase